MTHFDVENQIELVLSLESRFLPAKLNQEQLAVLKAQYDEYQRGKVGGNEGVEQDIDRMMIKKNSKDD